MLFKPFGCQSAPYIVLSFIYLQENYAEIVIINIMCKISVVIL